MNDEVVVCVLNSNDNSMRREIIGKIPGEFRSRLVPSLGCFRPKIKPSCLPWRCRMMN